MKKRKNFGIILHILKILQTETDAEHLITQKELVKRLRQKGINCRRYTIECNIECLRHQANIVKKTGLTPCLF